MLKRSAVPAGAILPGPPELMDAAAPLPVEAAAAEYVSSAPRPTTSTLQALKDELFELETDRITGRITAAEYAEHKAAFDVVLRRALSRIETGSAASNV